MTIEPLSMLSVLADTDVREWIGDPETTVGSLAHDNRSVEPEALFFCIPGARTDGHKFAASAIDAGAVGLVVERPLGDADGVPSGVTQAVVARTRDAMAPAALRLYRDPAANGLAVFGVTGTNGKTTVTFLIRHLLTATGTGCGMLGTVCRVIGGERLDAERTTAESIELQRDLRRMLDSGDRAAAIEVSSHALELGRVHGTGFAAAIFTNLTPEHLDFHEDMDSYFDAKRQLFIPGLGDIGEVAARIVNIDDPYGARLAAELDALGLAPVRVSAAGRQEAQYRAVNVTLTTEGSCFGLVAGDSAPVPVDLPMPGGFNVANALCAFAAVDTWQRGEATGRLIAALGDAPSAPGRMQPVPGARDFQVVVDYAHTPDSLENALLASRELTDGRLIVVFGAGGDRDRTKRPLMGAAAARLADIAVVTSDNPRSENPDSIIDEIVAGMDEGDAEIRIEADREQAIRLAIEAAGAGDLVLIAGKGHEQGQEFENGRKVPFDDVSVAAKWLGKEAANR